MLAGQVSRSSEAAKVDWRKGKERNDQGSRPEKTAGETNRDQGKESKAEQSSSTWGRTDYVRRGEIARDHVGHFTRFAFTRRGLIHFPSSSPWSSCFPSTPLHASESFEMASDAASQISVGALR